MSNYNSPEYRAIKKCSPDLATAVKGDLTWLSEALSAAELITEDNAASLKNQFIGAPERAAQLVSYVLNGVSLNTDNYHTFVGVLEKRKDLYKQFNILQTLDKKFRELGGRYPPSKPSESYNDDDEIIPPAPKRAKAGTSSLSTRDPSNVTTVIDFDAPKVIDFDEVDSTSTTQNKAEVLSSGTKKNSFSWCSFTGQQDVSVQPLASASNQAYPAVFQHGVNLWKEPQVTVAITNKSIGFLDDWGLAVEDILNLANRWYEQQKEPKHIPKFVHHAVKGADIIVELNVNGRNESLLGNAGKAGSTDPTMWLDLSGKDKNYNEHLVVHEFGHALGLGHEHQRSDFRDCVIPFLDETKMRKKLGDRYKDWERNDELDVYSATEYDPNSVMHYWFEKQWLKYGYDDRKKIQDHSMDKAKILSEKMKNALLGVHDCSVPLTQPSTKDLEFLNREYGKIKSKQTQ